MEAELITIGDEILIGQTIDTNSAWMAKALNAIGIKIAQIRSIKDEEMAIVNALDSVDKDIKLVLMTGGLGPTKDDITKKVLCRYFNTQLVRNKAVLERIESFFTARGRDILEVNRQQADLPAACTVLDNEMGTASGMWFEEAGRVYVSMPGVPYEMKHLMSERVIPRVREQFSLPHLYHKTIMTEGIGESFLAELISSWEKSLEEEAIKIAYLPSPGVVKIRLSAENLPAAALREKVDRKVKELYQLIPQYIFGEDDIPMEEAIGISLKQKGKTVATAESCTGGYIAHLLTSISGSSDYFKGSIVSYANEVKINSLKVREEDIQTKGAVSKEVVEQMALRVRKQLGTDYGLATSGVAGPKGGSAEKPVGTVWIALASEKGVFAKKFQFEKNRERNIQRSALAALSMLRREMNGELKYSTTAH
jgi:nicotinamide-nucleotide amidase